MGPDHRNNDNNTSNKEKQSQTNNNNILYNKERVIQRNTYYISNNKKYYNNIRARFRIRRDHIINFRVNDEELDILISIAEKIGANTLSQVIREAIMIYNALLIGVKEINTGKVVVQNPVVNLNIVNTNVKTEAKAESKPKISIDLKEIIELIERLYHLSQDNPRMPPLQKDLIKRLYKKIMAIEN